MPQDVASVLREEPKNESSKGSVSTAVTPVTPVTPATTSEHWMEFGKSQVAPVVSTDDDDNPQKSPTHSSDPGRLAPQFSPGQRLVLPGRMYTVRKYLSQGNCGNVWLVQDSATSEMRVIKIPKRRKDIQGFMEEVELHRSLTGSSFIVGFVESFEHQGWPGMVLEACRFGSANAMLEAGRMAGKKMVEESMVAHVLLHVLLGLSYLHSNGVVHRDIKLDNVMVDDALTFKLGDFGTARRITNMMTTFAGTPVYMAPEVLRRDPYNEKSDIWSLGHMLYEMCSQELLFDPSTLQSLVAKHDKPYKDIDRSFYSTSLSETIAWMLMVDPEMRPSASELLASPYVRGQLNHALHATVALRQSIHSSGGGVQQRVSL